MSDNTTEPRTRVTITEWGDTSCGGRPCAVTEREAGGLDLALPECLCAVWGERAPRNLDRLAQLVHDLVFYEGTGEDEFDAEQTAFMNAAFALMKARGLHVGVTM